MCVQRVLTTLGLVVLWSAGAGSAVAQSNLVLHGSNTIGEQLAPNLVEAWLQQRGCAQVKRSSPGVDQLQIRAQCEGETVQVDIHAYGTGTGFAELKAGRADLWMASRPVSAAELAQAGDLLPLDSVDYEHVVALDGLSVIVHPRNTLRSLTMAQVREIFAGRIVNWQQVGGPNAAIRLHARDDKSGTWDSFRSMVLGSTSLSPGAARYESSEALSRSVASDPQAIGFVGLAAVGGARALAIADGTAAAMAPAADQVATEDYPLARRLFLYSGPSSTPAAAELLAFSLSDAGQRVVEHTGFIGLALRTVNVPVARAEGQAAQDYQEVVDSAQRLGLNFRFSERTAALDNRAARDVQRLVEFMRRPENQGRSVRLAGFADANEMAYGALVLSTDRADFVAMMLNRAGVPVRRVRGLGQQLPVADNGTTGGRARNRRVEVWIDGSPIALGSGSKPVGSVSAREGYQAPAAQLLP